MFGSNWRRDIYFCGKFRLSEFRMYKKSSDNIYCFKVESVPDEA